MSKNYNSGSPDVPPHSHDGGDGLQVDIVNVIGISSVASNNIKYLNPTTGRSEISFLGNLTPGNSSHAPQTFDNTDVTFLTRVPIIQGNGVGVQSSFNGGYAPNGTLMFFANGTLLNGLYVRANDQWYGVNLPNVA